MNISTQLCGLILLLLFFIFYTQKNTLKLKTGNAFLLLLCVTFLSISLDIISIIAINSNTVSEHMTLLICKLYLISLITESFCGLRYVNVDVYSFNHAKLTKSTKIYLLILFVSYILVALIPIHYICIPEENICYSYGPSVITTYAFAVFFIIVTLVTIFRHKQDMNPKRWEAVEIWVFVWLCAALIQFLNNRLLVVGYACALGVTIIYLMLENPQTNLDRKTGLFNQSALMQYIQDLFADNKDFSLILFVIENSFQNDISPEEIQTTEINFSSVLLNQPNCIPFLNDDDEFILLIPDSSVATEIFDDVCLKLRQFFKENNKKTLSYNSILLPDSDVFSKPSDLLEVIRYVRHNYKDCYDNQAFVITQEIIDNMKNEHNTELFIKDAIADNRIEVFYQPIYSIYDDDFTSAEALVRIRDKDGSIVLPGVFIDIAEKNGLIIQLGELIFEHVCEFLEHNDITKYGLKYIEVNLSVVQCGYKKLAYSYIEIMKKHNINPSFINLEITESASTNAKKILHTNMTSLIDYGISFSLDDFGTGHSNLNYIIDMPVNIIKFDRSMTMSYFESGKAKYVMDAAMHMIQGLELKIVSEGIETKEQFDEMKKLGINYIQGFYFSKPLPHNEFLDFIQCHH